MCEHATSNATYLGNNSIFRASTHKNELTWLWKTMSQHIHNWFSPLRGLVFISKELLGPLPLTYKLLHRPPRLLNRRSPIRVMKLVEIDIIGLQAAQTLFNLVPYARWPE